MANKTDLSFTFAANRVPRKADISIESVFC
jgi:hypothetical protein